MSVIQNICHLVCLVWDSCRVTNDSTMMEKSIKKQTNKQTLEHQSSPFMSAKVSTASFYLTPSGQIQCVCSCLAFVKFPE